MFKSIALLCCLAAVGQYAMTVSAEMDDDFTAGCPDLREPGARSEIVRTTHNLYVVKMVDPELNIDTCACMLRLTYVRLGFSRSLCTGNHVLDLFVFSASCNVVLPQWSFLKQAGFVCCHMQ